MTKDKSNREELEQAIEKTLTTGEMDRIDPEKGAKGELGTRYEIRVRAEWDPVAEETKIIRSMVKEPDDRYDRWANPPKTEK